jgi:hypothetical protein
MHAQRAETLVRLAEQDRDLWDQSKLALAEIDGPEQLIMNAAGPGAAGRLMHVSLKLR